MPNNIINWDLKKIISDLTSDFEQIKEVYLFGSRAYKTNSLRSDIDLLIVTEKPIAPVHLYDWRENNYEAIDIFKTIDKKHAESAINGSVIYIRDGYVDLISQLDAIPLWNSTDTFSTVFEDWIQNTREGIDFKPTYAFLPLSISDAIKNYEKYLSENDFPNTNLGDNWEQIGQRIFDKIDTALNVAKSWTGSSGTFNSIKLSLERDFQNFVELVIKPWLPSTQRESCVAVFDGQEKNIDFSIGHNRILIEAKHIKDSNTEAKAVKEIEGIIKFYLSNTNVKLLLFICLVETDFPKDIKLFEDTFTKKNDNTIIITKCFKNILR